ncbi:MAG TPA: TIR domain-containing protein [Bacteroidia bacterium]|nr:TIR domain-containing protein [Bacteroidia bacterium]
MPKVFISYNYKDAQLKSTVDNWKNQGLGTDVSFTSEDRENHLSKGENYVTQVLNDHIAKAQKVLVLVGSSTHKRPWVDHEVAYAKSQGKQVLWTQLPGTDGAAPEEIRNTPPVPFNLGAIQNALRKP